jgi:hypothetical protein
MEVLDPSENHYHINILNLIATCTSHKLAKTSTVQTKQVTYLMLEDRSSVY